MYKLLLGFAIVGVVVSTPTPRFDDVRIVGGESVDITEVPYQVSVQYLGRHYCGGAIVDNDIIITAAHCVLSPFSTDYSVRVGSSSSLEGGEIYPVGEISPHPQFSYTKLDNDIAVLWLAEPLEYSSKVAPIKMANPEDVIEIGEITTVTGWGALREQGASSPQSLQRVFIPKVSKEVCSAAYLPQYTITPRMICAAAPGGGKDACQGDSGGPMVHDGKLVGVVSWGIGCARPQYPGVYARVSALRNWVDSNINYLRLKHVLRL